MPHTKSPYVIQKTKYKTYILSLNITSGLPSRVCDEWRRKSYQNFPPELAIHSNPKSMPAAKIAADALVSFLKKKLAEGNGCCINVKDISIGAWVEKFTVIDKSSRTGINASKNRSYSAEATMNSAKRLRVILLAKSEQFHLQKSSPSSIVVFWTTNFWIRVYNSPSK